MHGINNSIVCSRSERDSFFFSERLKLHAHRILLQGTKFLNIYICLVLLRRTVTWLLTRLIQHDFSQQRLAVLILLLLQKSILTGYIPMI